MGDRASKDALFDGLADAARAIANGRRAELIDVLAQGERHVDDLAREIGQSVANTSYHLRVLATAGLVATRREGTRVYYRLASERVGELWVALREVASAHHEEIASHPETGDPLVGASLPQWRELRELNAACARLFAPVRYHSLDIAITENGPVVIEINFGGGFDLPQFATGKGLLTDEIRGFFESCGYRFDRRFQPRRNRNA